MSLVLLEEVEDSVVQSVECWVSHAGGEELERAWNVVVLALAVEVLAKDVTSENVVGTVVFLVVRVAVTLDEVTQVVETLWGVKADLFAEFVVEESRVDSFQDTGFQFLDVLLVE